MHTTFPIASTSTSISQLLTGEDWDVIEPNILRWVKTQYMDSPKVKGIQDSISEQIDEKQRQEQAKSELTSIAEKAIQFYEKYVKN